jgi:hypothetical protein
MDDRTAPTATEARAPFYRLCAGRLVAANRSAVHRTSAPAGGAIGAVGNHRAGDLRRNQLGLSITTPNTLTVSGKKFGTLALLVVPSDTAPAAAHAAVMAAADPDDASTAEELLAIGMQAMQDDRPAS